MSGRASVGTERSAFPDHLVTLCYERDWRNARQNDTMIAMSEKVAIELDSAEALVLFELLSAFTDSGQLDMSDEPERVALWNLCALLERTLVEPFDPEYDALLARARESLRAKS